MSARRGNVLLCFYLSTGICFWCLSVWAWDYLCTLCSFAVSGKLSCKTEVEAGVVSKQPTGETGGKQPNQKQGWSMADAYQSAGPWTCRAWPVSLFAGWKFVISWWKTDVWSRASCFSQELWIASCTQWESLLLSTSGPSLTSPAFTLPDLITLMSPPRV